MTTSKTISVFEHESLRLNNNDEEKKLFESLRKFHGEKGVPYFSLTYNGVKFNEFVGVLQVGNQLIEVLPKADRPIINDIIEDVDKSKEADTWRKLLIDMLRTVGVFDIKAPSSSALKLNPNSILELYYELFLNEVDYLLHRGLIKKYKKTEGNLNCLKGSIQFSKNIQQNLVHQERFYTKYTTYSVDHTFHQILFKAVELVGRLNRNVNLTSKLSAIQMNFPDVASINVNEATFEKLSFNRNSEHYRNAISIARLLLLNYHPDISKGKDNVLAIMFDMNVLWEKFAVASLRKSFRINDLPYLLESQCSKDFWIPMNASARTIRPDISITIPSSDPLKNKIIILDTKWKNVEKSNKISLDILRQMYVYHEYFNADQVAIVFPGEQDLIAGKFDDRGIQDAIAKKCALLPVSIGKTIDEIHNHLFNVVNNFLK